MRKAHFGVRLERTPVRGGRRYYEIAIGRDLFGAPVMLCSWGGVDAARGGAQFSSFASLDAARRAAARWLRVKRRRGYRRARRG